MTNPATPQSEERQFDVQIWKQSPVTAELFRYLTNQINAKADEADAKARTATELELRGILEHRKALRRLLEQIKSGEFYLNAANTNT